MARRAEVEGPDILRSCGLWQVIHQRATTRSPRSVVSWRSSRRPSADQPRIDYALAPEAPLPRPPDHRDGPPRVSRGGAASTNPRRRVMIGGGVTAETRSGCQSAARAAAANRELSACLVE